MSYDDEYDDGNETEYDAPESSPEDRILRAVDGASVSPEDDPWDDVEALEGLTMDRAVHPDETNEMMTKRLMEEAGPAAAASIIHLALRSSNDNTRLRAATYITDKVYGDESGKTGEQLWEKVLAESMKKIEDHANQ